jgi:hypothetical protein
MNTTKHNLFNMTEHEKSTLLSIAFTVLFALALITILVYSVAPPEPITIEVKSTTPYGMFVEDGDTTYIYKGIAR